MAEDSEKDGRGRRIKASPISERVRELFLEYGQVSPYELYKTIKEEFKAVYGRTSYTAFYFHYIYIPRELGLIRRVEEKKKRKPFTRVYYRIAPGKEDSPMWNNPQKYYNPITSLGRARYSILKKAAREEGISMVDAFFKEYPDVAKEVARARGMKPSALKRWLKARFKA